MQFRILPATPQGGKKLRTRYEEAVPNVPGSGMVKPKRDLGFIVLELRLELTAPGTRRFGLLAAYAQTAPLDPWPEDDTEGPANSGGSTPEVQTGAQQGNPKPKMVPKTIRGNMNRLKRCFRIPYLLQGPQVFTLPFAWFAVCFYAKLYHLPWVALVLVAASGLLDHLHCGDRTKDMIFWEREVGEDDMPKGFTALKNLGNGLATVQEAAGKVAGFLEKQRNLVNFADASVSLVALLCLACVAGIASALLFLVPLPVIAFVAGTLCLLPFLARAVGWGSDPPLPPEPDRRPVAKSRLRGAVGYKPHACWLQMLLNVLGRVPDAKDLAHWHVCQGQVMPDADKLSLAKAGKAA